jgi:hypothetical protein
VKILPILNEGDEVIIIPLADIQPGKQYEPLHSVSDIRKAILEMRTKDAQARVEDGLHVASSTLSNSLNINKELYFFTDAQKSNFVITDSLKEQLTLFDERTKMYLVEVGTEAKNLRNLSMDSIKSVTTIFEPGRPLEFELFIRNGGEQPVENAGLSLFYNDERVAQRTLPAKEPRSTERITLSASPKGTGSLGIRAELEEDALPFDNKRYFAIEIPNARRIGLFFAMPSDAQFVKLALAQTTSTGDVLPFVIEEHRVEELRMLPSLRSRSMRFSSKPEVRFMMKTLKALPSTSVAAEALHFFRVRRSIFHPSIRTSLPSLACPRSSDSKNRHRRTMLSTSSIWRIHSLPECLAVERRCEESNRRKSQPITNSLQAVRR